jgi:hypothetical protein
MKPRWHVPILMTAVALASCATTSLLPYPPLGATQQLEVRTDPAGATCTVFQGGTPAAAVDSTPGIATVRRDFCPVPTTPFQAWSTPDYCKGSLERIAPLDIVCRKQGYLELRRTFSVARAATVQSEDAPTSEPTAASQVAGGLAAIGSGAAYHALGDLAAASFVEPRVALLLLPVTVAVAAERSNQPTNFAYAYRSLPAFFLVPATFASEAERDAGFASLEAKLRAEGDAQRAYIDRQCRYFPCKASDPAPCLDPVCQRRRERVDAQLASQLDEIPALRTQVRIVAPSE